MLKYISLPIMYVNLLIELLMDIINLITKVFSHLN